MSLMDAAKHYIDHAQPVGAGTATVPFNVAYSAADLHTGEVAESSADTPFHAASTMKIAVMAEALRLAQSGLLPMRMKMPLTNRFISAGSGQPYVLNSEEDGDPELYFSSSQRAQVRDLVVRMIVRSSNLATNLLIDRIGADNVTATMRRWGLPGIVVRRGVQDLAAFKAGYNNTVTAGDLRNLLQRIAEGRAVNKRASQRMVNILLKQQFNEGIPGLLPAGTRVAHKTGAFEGLYHDAGIVYREGKAPLVLAVLTTGFAPDEAAHTFVAGLAKALVTRG